MTMEVLSGLANRLVTHNLISRDKAFSAINEAKKEKLPFVKYLVQQNVLSAYQIAFVAAKDFGLPLFDLETYDPEMFPHHIVTEQLILQHQALPLMRRGNRLYLAMSDPTNQEAINEFTFHTNMMAQTIVVEADKLDKTINTILSTQKITIFDHLDEDDLVLDDVNITAGDSTNQLEDDKKDADDAPVVRFVHKILLDAINKGASDIHFEIYEKICRIRFRIDGILYEMTKPPITIAHRIVSRIKVMSQLDISERRIPQDGRFKMILSKNRSVDFRISTCPMTNGEKAVLRILDASTAKIDIDLLGFEPWQKQIYLDAIAKPQGMILVTGPTGSGKTVTLYSALNILNIPDSNISTVEDPVEIYMQGINQMNVNTKIGLDFSTALRAFLRQDPDIIMVGEIRDTETAEIAIKAAQTGHLVLSTLHTNSAPATISRLVNMGIPYYNIATSVSLIMAQRLVRRLCPACKKCESIPEQTLLDEGFYAHELSELKIYGPVGCEKCTKGYSDRVGIYELLVVTPLLARTMMAGAHAIDIADQARKEGFQTLRESGLEKVRQGVTSLIEVNRITKD